MQVLKLEITYAILGFAFDEGRQASDAHVGKSTSATGAWSKYDEEMQSGKQSWTRWIPKR